MFYHYRFLLTTYALICLASCGKSIDNPGPAKEDKTGQLVDVTIKASLPGLNLSKTAYQSTGIHNAWKQKDISGMLVSTTNGSLTDTRISTFGLSSNMPASAKYSGKLTERGQQTYTFHFLSPYLAFSMADRLNPVSSRLEDRQYPDLKSWDGTCDLLVSEPQRLESKSLETSNVKLQLTRLFGVLEMSMASSIIDSYGEETIQTITLSSDNPSDKLAGKFTLDLSGTALPSVKMSTTDQDCSNSIVLDYLCKTVTLSEITPFFIVNAGTYADVTVNVKTSKHCLTFKRTGLTIMRNELTCFPLELTKDDLVIDAPQPPECSSKLRVLTFGHSYVDDSMEYMDDLLNASEIKNVSFSHFFIGNASLQKYWEHVTDPGNTKGGTDKITFRRVFTNGQAYTYQSSTSTIIDALCEEDWDFVVFQTNLDCTTYLSADIFLKKLIAYVRETCREQHKREPVIAWHIISPLASQSYMLKDSFYGSQEYNYASHIAIAKEIIRNNDIQLVIPTGTAIQSLRHSSLNNSYSGSNYYEFTRDGDGLSHMDNMAGRYTCACTWFEAFVKPYYGISVLGNTFHTTARDAGVPVTDQNCIMFQRAAVLACQNPFEISDLDAYAK